jgi:hypothetical protein
VYRQTREQGDREGERADRDDGLHSLPAIAFASSAAALELARVPADAEPRAVVVLRDDMEVDVEHG